MKSRQFFIIILYFFILVVYCDELFAQSTNIYNQLKDGLDAYRNGQFRQAYTILEPIAKTGEAQAQFTLGMMYSGGYGVTLDEYQAAHWFKLAANQGHRDSQYFLAQLYEQGWGVPYSKNQAINWYRLCAEQLDSRCKTKLGVIDEEKLDLTNSPIPTISNQAINERAIKNNSNDNTDNLVTTSQTVSTNNQLTVIESTSNNEKLLGEDWVHMQKSSNYTLQIFSSTVEQDLYNYVRKYSLKGELAIISELRNGQIWYNLIYGSFPTSSAVNKARASLPHEINKSGIWARQFRKLTIAANQDKIIH